MLQHFEVQVLKVVRVVDGDQSDVVQTIPARLATTSDRVVHDVVVNEKVALKQLGAPAEHSGQLQLLFAALRIQLLKALHQKQAAISFATYHVVVQTAQKLVVHLPVDLLEIRFGQIDDALKGQVEFLQITLRHLLL